MLRQLYFDGRHPAAVVEYQSRQRIRTFMYGFRLYSGVRDALTAAAVRGSDRRADI